MRARAEALMLDTFTAYAYTWTKVGNLDKQVWLAQYTTPGKVAGRSRQGDTNTRTETVGGVERPVVEGGLHIPLSAPVPAVGWEFACTAVGASSDPSLLGRRWRVVDVPAKSFATARRLDVVEVPAP
ncbi:DUF6093 family protein [Nocardioides sp. YIM 152315]|uniref:DUF6093 family protein n=1 Tax=Nocardioides sp. YIM 152315 TaxID=3031760 RepID=UPI0023DCD177|nr:DUF6093 family protein [Nocardioides sp. YIM 152315]MDF1603395.1 DUF6093 family protein [Nocardioides sp. YIM 152315]